MCEFLAAILIFDILGFSTKKGTETAEIVAFLKFKCIIIRVVFARWSNWLRRRPLKAELRVRSPYG